MATKKKATAAKPATKAKAKAKPKAKVHKEAAKLIADNNATADDMMKMPSEAAVKGAAAVAKAAREESGEIAADASEKMAEFKKGKGIHPGALKRVERLVNKGKKTDCGLSAVATEIAHFEYYCDVLGLTKMIEQQGQMFARPEAGETGEDEETSTDAGEKTDDMFKPLHEAAPKFGGPKSRAKAKPKPDETIEEFTEREVNESFGAEPTIN